MRFINIGFSNLVAAERIVAVASPDSAPLKRLIADSREDGRAIDCTCGKKMKSILITDSDHVILSALTPDAISARIEGHSDPSGESISEEEL